MAYELGHAIDLKSNEGGYILPFEWMDYGLSNGFLSITNPERFYQSVQGCCFCVAKECGWGSIEGYFFIKEGKFHPIVRVDQPYYDFKSGNQLIFMTLEEFLADTDGMQILASDSHMAMLRGCGLKLNRRVWNPKLTELDMILKDIQRQ